MLQRFGCLGDAFTASRVKPIAIRMKEFSTLRKFRLRTLLLTTAFAAIGIATFRPFTPSVSILSIVPTPVSKPYSSFDGKYRQYKLTLQNDGHLPVWLRPGDTTISDFTWLSVADESTEVDINIYQDECTKLSAGRTRTYRVVVDAKFEEFRLFVHARDWRGRDGYDYLGKHRTDPEIVREVKIERQF